MHALSTAQVFSGVFFLLLVAAFYGFVSHHDFEPFARAEPAAPCSLKLHCHLELCAPMVNFRFEYGSASARFKADVYSPAGGCVTVEPSQAEEAFLDVISIPELVADEVSLQIAGDNYTFWYQNTSLDALAILDEIFRDEDYSIRTMADLQTGDPGEFSLELGANLGMTSAVYLRKFPSSKFVAFEPDPLTAGFNVRNLAANYANATHWARSKPWSQLATGSYTLVLAAAGWDSNLVFNRYVNYPSGSHLTTREACPDLQNIKIECIDVVVVPLVQALATLGATKIPWLKVDCEGCEFDVFCAPPRAEIEAVLAVVESFGGEVHLHRNTRGYNCSAYVQTIFAERALRYVVQTQAEASFWRIYGRGLPIEGIPHEPFKDYRADSI